MKRFCEDVLNFLESEYDDSYYFNIEYRKALDHKNDSVKLVIELSPRYKTIIDDYAMFCIFGWYRSGDFIEERKQYRWQKELIDMIEGG
jgi:23S rRNA G2069 N7-methylase RlmK/C1962 C5-methylase RlmI